MEVERNTINDNNPIFLSLSSQRAIFIPIDRNYLFFGNNDEQYESKDLYKLVDPSIDATFKFLFADPDTELLSDALNSILFPDFPNNPQLTNIEIINNEIVKPAQKQNKGTIRADVACSASYNGERIILGIEMQIGVSTDFTTRLLNYNVGLRYRNGYKTTWTLGLLVHVRKKEEDESSYTQLNKKINHETIKLDDLNMGELDLYTLIKKINNNEDIFINGKKLRERGKEWIKLLGLRTWATQKFDKYLIPKNYKLSDNPKLMKAIQRLSNIPIDVINNSLVEEKELQKYFEDLDKAEKDGEIKGIIKSSFGLFASSCPTEITILPLLDKKFEKEEVYSSLAEYSEQNKDFVDKYVEFLGQNNYLLD